MTTAAIETVSPAQSGEELAFDAIKSFLDGSAVLGGNGEIRRDLPLLESGILDSLGILQLVNFLGDELGVTVEDEDFVAENFETVGSLARFVAAKRGATEG